MTSNVKYMDIKEFVELGFLQEVNRVVLHPCGLALEVARHNDGTYSLSGVWDYRDDPEGIVFTDGPDYEKFANVEDEFWGHSQARHKEFGWFIQPPGEGVNLDEN